METPPADRVLGATRTCLGGLFIGDSSNFLPGYLTAPFFLCALPFAAVEDVVCLPYDLYLVGRYARNPSVAYCVLKGRNDKLHKLLEAGASVYDSGSGPFHLLETPEEIAIRCNKEALTELWSHGLKVSPKAIRYLAGTLHVPLYEDRMKGFRLFQLCNAALEKVAEDDDWDNFRACRKDLDWKDFLKDYSRAAVAALKLASPDGGDFWDSHIHSSYRKKYHFRYRKEELVAQYPKMELAFLNSLELLLSHGFNPNTPTTYYMDKWGHFYDGYGTGCPRRITFLDWVLVNAEIPGELRARLVALLGQFGALTYVQLLRQDADLPRLPAENINVNPKYQQIVDFLQGSTMAPYYRLSTTWAGFSGEVLVVEAGFKDRNGETRYTCKVPVLARNQGNEMIWIDLPIDRMIFYPVATAEEFNYRQGKEVTRRSDNGCPSPHWLADDFIFPRQFYVKEAVYSFPGFELYHQSSNVSGKYLSEAYYSNPRIYQNDEFEAESYREKGEIYRYEFDLLMQFLTSLATTGKDAPWKTTPKYWQFRP